MRTRALLLLLSILPTMGCKKKEGSAGQASDSAQVHAAGKPVTVDAMIQQAFVRVGQDGRAMESVAIDYVQADGTLHPEYGNAVFRTTLVEAPRAEPVPPPDDPDRPIGAPLPERPYQPDPMLQRMMADCPVYTWRAGAGALSRDRGSCSLVVSTGGVKRPRCSLLQLWRRALDAGAPPKALARIELGDGQQWRFVISDPPRNIDFRGEYADDCPPMVETP